jgi:hypothetical protein
MPIYQVISGEVVITGNKNGVVSATPFLLFQLNNYLSGVNFYFYLITLLVNQGVFFHAIDQGATGQSQQACRLALIAPGLVECLLYHADFAGKPPHDIRACREEGCTG